MRFDSHSRQQALQHRPDLTEVARERYITRSDHQPASGRIAHLRLVAQQQQGVLQRPARNALGMGQFVLTQSRAGWQLAIDNLGEDRVVDLVNQAWLKTEGAHGVSAQNLMPDM